MSATELDLRIDQGADWAMQIWWLTGESSPYNVTGPMRMEIRDEVGGVAVTLQTNENSEDVDADPGSQQILYNSESGLIQLSLGSDETDRLGASNHYIYDLFVHYSDPITGVVRKKKLIKGSVQVERRVTRNV